MADDDTFQERKYSSPVPTAAKEQGFTVTAVSTWKSWRSSWQWRMSCEVAVTSMPVRSLADGVQFTSSNGLTLLSPVRASIPIPIPKVSCHGNLISTCNSVLSFIGC